MDTEKSIRSLTANNRGMYEKSLKRKKDGSFERWLGVNLRGTKQVFRMSAAISQEEAEWRWKQIEALWQQIESEVVAPDAPVQSLDDQWFAAWDEERLATAKRIAKGEKKPPMDRRLGESSIGYVKRIVKTGDLLDTELIPADQKTYELGVANLKKFIAVSSEQLGKAIGKPGIQLIGVTLGQGFEAYREDLQTRKKYKKADGSRKPWGKTQLDNLKSMTGFYLKEFLVLDIGELNNNRCDEIVDIFANRPMTQRGTPLKLSAAKHFVKQVRAFFRWLDVNDAMPWDLPRKFDIRKPIEYRKADPDESVRLRNERENVTIPVEHLKIIAEYGTPLERLYFFLAINCAYGADQLGRLRTEWLDLNAAKIDGERLKVESISRHHLWSVCVDGLRRYIAKHNRDGLLFIAASGKPVYHESENGNVIDGFGSCWEKLIARIRKDKGNEFSKYSFGKLRKTAATAILKIADPHIASMLLAHKTVSDDELLRRYANLPWDNLYEAQRRAEMEMASVIEAAGPDPFGARPKTYIGLEKTKAILELDSDGFTPVQIAEKLGITAMTVYRHLQSKYGEQKPRERRELATNRQLAKPNEVTVPGPHSPSQSPANNQISATDWVAG